MHIHEGLKICTGTLQRFLINTLLFHYNTRFNEMSYIEEFTDLELDTERLGKG